MLAEAKHAATENPKKYDYTGVTVHGVYMQVPLAGGGVGNVPTGQVVINDTYYPKAHAISKIKAAMLGATGHTILVTCFAHGRNEEMVRLTWPKMHYAIDPKTGELCKLDIGLAVVSMTTSPLPATSTQPGPVRQ